MVTNGAAGVPPPERTWPQALLGVVFKQGGQVAELHALFNIVRKRVPLDRLYVNPNCGLEFLPHTQALAKVKRLVEAARSFRDGRN